jgi:preprotein translocase subunit SecG
VNALLLIVMIIWALSVVLLTIFVLMHSGKGTGLTESLSPMLQSSNVGTGIIEKNLNRATVATAIIFVLCILAMMLMWPAA